MNLNHTLRKLSRALSFRAAPPRARNQHPACRSRPAPPFGASLCDPRPTLILSMPRPDATIADPGNSR